MVSFLAQELLIKRIWLPYRFRNMPSNIERGPNALILKHLCPRHGCLMTQFSAENFSKLLTAKNTRDRRNLKALSISSKELICMEEKGFSLSIPLMRRISKRNIMTVKFAQITTTSYWLHRNTLNLCFLWTASLICVPICLLPQQIHILPTITRALLSFLFLLIRSTVKRRKFLLPTQPNHRNI